MQTFEDADSNNFVLGPAEIEFGQNKYDAFWYSFSEFSTHPANSTQGKLSFFLILFGGLDFPTILNLNFFFL